MKKIAATLSLLALLGCATPEKPEPFFNRPATKQEVSRMGTRLGGPAMNILASNLQHYIASPILGPTNQVEGVYAILNPKYLTNQPQLVKDGILASTTNVVSMHDGIYVAKGGHIGPQIKTVDELRTLLGQH